MPRTAEKREDCRPQGRIRTILAADDEKINLEILGEILEGEFRLLFAENGEETLEILRRERESLSIVLLDLVMPKLHGLQILKIMREDPLLKRIPVIVMTSDYSAEVECLNLGAIDFIPKPYPGKEVIIARVKRTIELCEDRDIIRATERDSLTGLYNREFFYRYAEQLERMYPGERMEAIVLDIDRFHMINERYGKAYGDEVLRHIADRLRLLLRGRPGIASRPEGDVFFVYTAEIPDHAAFLERLTEGLPENRDAAGRIRLRMGVYLCEDASLEMARRFDRAKSAADTVRGSFVKTIAVYDSALHESELFSGQLLEGFHEALREKQFRVFYQPKFDIRPEIPVLVSAEALVRWEHPTLGLIGPVSFIPLFEKNGLILELDRHVWREAAARIRDWKDRLGFSVPVSVNVSRVDIYDPGLADFLSGLTEEYGLKPEELLLEITESAYTEDTEQLVSAVRGLRERGFRIEMDDFGTGYSSLNMISTLPIDALKLDIQFIRNAFRGKRDTRMLEVILEIAEYLSVPVIAEGVETEEQLSVLRAMGCNMVQGFYFSRPVPPEEYEVYVEQRKQVEFPILKNCPMSGIYRRIFYVDLSDGSYVEFGTAGKHEDLQIQKSGSDFFAAAERALPRDVHPEDVERVARVLNKNFLDGELRKKKHVSIIYRMMNQGKAVYCSLRAVRPGIPDEHHVVIGIRNVSEIVKSTVEGGLSYSRITRALAADYFRIYYVNTETDNFLEYNTGEGAADTGMEKGGARFFERFRENIQNTVVPEDRDRVSAALEKRTLLKELLDSRTYTINYRVLIDGTPTFVSLKATRLDDTPGGHIIIGISNIDAQMKREQEYVRRLGIEKERANRDALTGVKSRLAWLDAEQELDRMIREGEAEPFAVAMCDVNNLKTVNDTEGHAAGDRFLRDACALICNTFKRSPVFRVGGDEFAALLRGQDYENREKLKAEFRERSRKARENGGIVVACGIADFLPGQDKAVAAVYERADEDMYMDKAELKK